MTATPTASITPTPIATIPRVSYAWVPRADLPFSLSGMGVTQASDGLIYVVGGASSNPVHNSREVIAYDPRTDTWARRAPLPTGLIGGGAVASNGKVYAIGGSGRGDDREVDAYDPATNTWTTKAPMPTARGDFTAVASRDGTIYVIGGTGDDNNRWELAVVEAYDPRSDTWTRKAPLPFGRLAMAGALGPDGRIYIFGGMGRPLDFNPDARVLDWHPETLAYDPTSDRWINLGPMPEPRYNLAAATAMNGKIYVSGGSDSLGRILATVDEYDPRTNSWRQVTDLPEPRDGSAAVGASDGSVYVFGGSVPGIPGDRYPEPKTIEELLLVPVAGGTPTRGPSPTPTVTVTPTVTRTPPPGPYAFVRLDSIGAPKVGGAVYSAYATFHVQDERGQPIGNAVVNATWTKDARTFSQLQAITTPDGRFQLTTGPFNDETGVGIGFQITSVRKDGRAYNITLRYQPTWSILLGRTETVAPD